MVGVGQGKEFDKFVYITNIHVRYFWNYEKQRKSSDLLHDHVRITFMYGNWL